MENVHRDLGEVTNSPIAENSNEDVLETLTQKIGIMNFYISPIIKTSQKDSLEEVVKKESKDSCI